MDAYLFVDFGSTFTKLTLVDIEKEEIIAIGLVPELTAEAAKRAALGAGSRVIKTYSFNLNSDEIKEIESYKADIILLAGGTDGGDKNCIIHNANTSCCCFMWSGRTTFKTNCRGRFRNEIFSDFFV